MPYYNHTLFISSIDVNDQTDIVVEAHNNGRVYLCQGSDEVSFDIDELQLILDTARKMQKSVKTEQVALTEFKGQIGLFEALDREDRF